MIVKESKTTIFIKKMYITRLMIYLEQIEEEKLKEMDREFKRSRTNNGGFSQQRSTSCNDPNFIRS